MNKSSSPFQKPLGRLLQTCVFAASSIVLAGLGVTPVQADETCMSPYMAKIVGQEDFVYVWTLGMEGVGDEQDKLVTIDVNPKSKNYGKVINTLSVGGRNEAHHSGFTDDRQYLWAGGLDTTSAGCCLHTGSRTRGTISSS